MTWSVWAAWAVAVAVGCGLTALGWRDARTGRVPVGPARRLTFVAVAGLFAVGALSGAWGQLGEALAGAVLVTVIQVVPYALQVRRKEAWIGRADVRLGVPFGWTLGWFGLGFVVVGFLSSLVGGLVVAAVTRRHRIPFVPLLAVGYWVALIWAAVVSVISHVVAVVNS